DVWVSLKDLGGAQKREPDVHIGFRNGAFERSGEPDASVWIFGKSFGYEVADGDAGRLAAVDGGTPIEVHLIGPDDFIRGVGQNGGISAFRDVVTQSSSEPTLSEVIQAFQNQCRVGRNGNGRHFLR